MLKGWRRAANDVRVIVQPEDCSGVRPSSSTSSSTDRQRSGRI